MKKSPKDKLSQSFHARLTTCKDCGIQSKYVSHSYRFNKNLCMECLRENVLSQNNKLD